MKTDKRRPTSKSSLKSDIKAKTAVDLSKPRKLGELPSYLKKSKNTQHLARESALLKKKFNQEKSKLALQQANFMKVYNDCKKAHEKASLAFGDTFKIVMTDGENVKMEDKTESAVQSVKEEYKNIVQEVLDECKIKIKEFYPDRPDVFSNIEIFLHEEFQKKLEDMMKVIFLDNAFSLK